MADNVDQRDHKADPAQNAQRGAHAANPAVAEPKDQFDASAHDAHGSYQHTHPPDWVSRSIALFALIVSGVAAAIGYFQWQEMHRQTANADRPWVGIDASTPGNAITIDDIQFTPPIRVKAHFTIKNFGNRPALKVNPLVAASTNFQEVVMMWGVPECAFPAFITKGVKGLPSQGQVLFPNETMPGKLDQFTNLSPRTTKFWIAGCISYLDQFKKEHWTRFCYEVGDGKSPVSKDSPMEACQLYNDTDETENQRSDFEMLFPKLPQGATKPAKK